MHLWLPGFLLKTIKISLLILYFCFNVNCVFLVWTVSNRTFVTLQHNWTQIFSGETVTVICEIEGGTDTDWEYEWRTTSSNTPPTHSEYRISSVSVSHSGDYWCKGRRDLFSSTEWSDAFTLTVSCKSDCLSFILVFCVCFHCFSSIENITFFPTKMNSW